LKGALDLLDRRKLDLLRSSGLVDIMAICTYVCFEGFIAVK